MPDCGGEFLNHLPAQITETFFFLSPVVKEELISEIKKLNPRKSCGQMISEPRLFNYDDFCR